MSMVKGLVASISYTLVLVFNLASPRLANDPALE